MRRPSPRLAEGIVTHLQRTPVQVELASAQHRAYASALAGQGWRVIEVPPADDCPDSVFIEDTVVACGSVAVLTRPGAAQRRPEVDGVESVVRGLGLSVARITEPGTLDGGDVLQCGSTVYVGLSGRTNAEGIRQLRRILAGVGHTVVAVPVRDVLHLKSATTALPDGTHLLFTDPSALAAPVDAGLFPAVRLVPEPAGAHVVLLGGDAILLAASAPRTAELLADLGYAPVVVDIGEFERLEGCVTCLSVLVPTL